ncbi:hypothetical protein BO83DRAFT_376511 [Aspergillus eucalypticola CBS 122712]|uniref:Uncharacterized protein n=1 Tax=Aspergillus eucalypticola (strain CBS 122712 / IBT 29274) TaxID=1448314 RepID=A0A317VZ14_ASPEC|nr:uncharacterized protein BO83DRAFT_376511 [Aspergillus eucalypticola CBS 122712]PWY79025.1 hypothetical protein BO83DRAFT_376511 [Aspergillus eucalypticola CBS 122712]
MKSIHILRSEEIGNPDAAEDLYGLGVRLGFYLQALAMILYMYGDPKTYGTGLKIASGSITVSVLASWLDYAAQSQFSPSEAIIVILYLMSLSLPAKYTLVNPCTIKGESIGILTLILTELATCAALLWTFATLVNTLPRLGTPNVTFFFASVSLTGWFRYLALVYCVFDATTSLISVSKMFRILHLAWKPDASSDESLMKNLQEIIQWEEWLIYVVWLNWAFAIIAIETTLVWNHLTPSNDLGSPGQLIPFVTGIILLLDSIAVVAKEHFIRYLEMANPIWNYWLFVSWLLGQGYRVYELFKLHSVRKLPYRQDEESGSGLENKSESGSSC